MWSLVATSSNHLHRDPGAPSSSLPRLKHSIIGKNRVNWYFCVCLLVCLLVCLFHCCCPTYTPKHNHSCFTAEKLLKNFKMLSFTEMIGLPSGPSGRHQLPNGGRVRRSGRIVPKKITIAKSRAVPVAIPGNQPRAGDAKLRIVLGGPLLRGYRTLATCLSLRSSIHSFLFPR